jgi:transcriptional regulator with XRE-family HTH domain
MPREKKTSAAKGPPPPPEMLGLPERLDRAMRSKKPRRMTQEQLADRSGVSQPSISNVLTGASLDGVTAATVARLAIGLDVTAGWLLLGDGDAIPAREPSRGEAPVELLEGEHSLDGARAKKGSPAPNVHSKAKRLR